MKSKALFEDNQRTKILQFWGSGSGGRISWDRNSTFSGGQIFDHEIEIPNNELLQNWSGDRICPWGP